MKKAKTLLPLAALALALGLAACTGPQPGGDESSAAGTSTATSSVAKPKITVSAEGDKKTLIVEETVQLTAKEGETALTGIEWKSSNEAVATVDQTGKVTAVGPGDAPRKATTKAPFPSKSTDLPLLPHSTSKMPTTMPPMAGGEVPPKVGSQSMPEPMATLPISSASLT